MTTIGITFALKVTTPLNIRLLVPVKACHETRLTSLRDGDFADFSAFADFFLAADACGKKSAIKKKLHLEPRAEKNPKKKKKKKKKFAPRTPCVNFFTP